MCKLFKKKSNYYFDWTDCFISDDDGKCYGCSGYSTQVSCESEGNRLGSIF
jgi:hypothetical protein